MVAKKRRKEEKGEPNITLQPTLLVRPGILERRNDREQTRGGEWAGNRGTKATRIECNKNLARQSGPVTRVTLPRFSRLSGFSRG